jgi:hypothetical protein
VEKSLGNFRTRSEGYARQSGLGFINFIIIGIQSLMLSRSLPRELHKIMHAQAKANHFTSEQQQGMEEMYYEYREKIVNYLQAVRDAAQFNTYERLFSWWHIFHIPLVYMMVFSAFYHVYAVHAY